MRRSLVMLLIGVLALSLVAVYTASHAGKQRTIIVPDEFSTIEKAIDNASAGDTVFVKKGTYECSSLVISKPLSLVGEDANETIIRGKPQSHSPYAGWETIDIRSSNVLVHNFTLTHCVKAIVINSKVTDIQITNNNFLSPMAIRASEASNLLISQNFFCNNRSRASTQIAISTENSIISYNTFSGNLGSISLGGAVNVMVYGNQIINNTFGIALNSVSGVSIFGNTIKDNTGYDSDSDDYGYGIEFGFNCNGTSIYDNDIVGNTNGVNLLNFLIDFPSRTTPPVFQGQDNVIYNNNFSGNSKNANVEHKYRYADTTDLVHFTIGTAIVSWDNGTTGNYWSDYNHKGTYRIDGNNVDYHPLSQAIAIQPVTSPLNTLPPPDDIQTIIGICIVTSVSIAIIFGWIAYFKKNRRAICRESIAAY